jgi:thiol:disulfide interchange protein
LPRYAPQAPGSSNLRLRAALSSRHACRTHRRAGSRRSSARQHFRPNRNPAADLKQAIAEAEQTHRRILLDVGGQWCIWCKYLDQFFDSHPDLKALRDKNYVWMKVNMSRENENKGFLSQYPSIPGYPHFFVLNPDGRFYHSQETRPLEDGFRSYNPDRMREFLIKWAPSQEVDTPLQ